LLIVSSYEKEFKGMRVKLPFFIRASQARKIFPLLDYQSAKHKVSELRKKAHGQVFTIPRLTHLLKQVLLKNFLKLVSLMDGIVNI